MFSESLCRLEGRTLALHAVGHRHRLRLVGMDRMIKVQRLTWIGKLAAGLLVTLMAASCGQFFPSSNTIVSITLSPTSAQIKPTATQQYTATGTFGNNTTGDVTSQVTWVSSATTIATISTAGLATAVALGTTNITAKSGSVISPASVLTVSNKTIVSIPSVRKTRL